jgi:hypothetical protein
MNQGAEGETGPGSGNWGIRAEAGSGSSGARSGPWIRALRVKPAPHPRDSSVR